MTQKGFLLCKIAIAGILASSVGVSVSMGNWKLPIILMAVSFFFLLTLKKKVKGVTADESDYKIAGKASFIAMTAYSLLAVFSGMIIFVSGRENPVFEAAGNVLFYSVLFLIFLYSILFKIYARKGERD